MEPFWVVWNPACGSPTVKHMTLESAKIEAIRLARENSGHEFFVLGSCGRAQKVDVEWRQVEQNVDIPF